MYAFYVTTLVLAASAVAPVLSAPLSTRSTSDVVARDGFPLGARDPELSVSNIRDLLDHLNLRSEDVIAALYKRDGGIADPILPRSRIVKPLGRDDDNDVPIVHGPLHTINKRSIDKVFGRDTVSARDYSEPLDPLKRDGPVDDIQARGFFDNLKSFFSDAVNDGFLQDPNIALRSVADRRASANEFIKTLSKISSRDGARTTSRRDDSGRKLSRGDDLRLLSNFVRSLERDGLVDDVLARDLFDDVGSLFSGAFGTASLDTEIFV